MTPRTMRLVRWGLVGAFGLITAAVGWTIRSPAPVGSAAPPLAGPAGMRAANSTTMGGFEYREFGSSRPDGLVVRAKTYEGRAEGEVALQGVSVDFPYAYKGQEPRPRGTIVSDEATFTPDLKKGVFRGHVRLTTQDGFEMVTEALSYRGDKGSAHSDEVVTFRRKDVSGSSTGFTYHGEDGRLEMAAEAFLKLENEPGSPTEIRGGRGVIERANGIARFLDGASVDQGADHLKANRLIVNFSEDGNGISRAQAIEGVELRLSGSEPLPGVAGGGVQGSHVLTCRKLDLVYRADRTLEEARAVEDAELASLPASGQAPEKTRLKARVLTFRFDEQGRPIEVGGQKDASYQSEPIPPAKGGPQTLACQTFVARIDPATRAVKNGEFSKDVVFTRGTQQALSQKAWYDALERQLILKESPEVLDAAQGSRLRAQAIDIRTDTQDISARHNVRHEVKRQTETKGLLGAKGETMIFTSPFLDYKPASRTVRYWNGVLLQSGKDEVRAAEIELQEGETGRRRLAAKGGVSSILHARAASDSAKGEPPAPVEGKSREMVYDETKGNIVYTGDAWIRQGDISTRSPVATVMMGDDSSIKTLEVGDPVEVEQGVRRATGSHGTYSPGTETMVLVGDKVVLKNPGQEVQGRSLTFRVGDDTILIDGREQVRTETIIRTKESPKP